MGYRAHDSHRRIASIRRIFPQYKERIGLSVGRAHYRQRPKGNFHATHMLARGVESENTDSSRPGSVIALWPDASLAKKSALSKLPFHKAMAWGCWLDKRNNQNHTLSKAWPATPLLRGWDLSTALECVRSDVTRCRSTGEGSSMSLSNATNASK